MTLFYECFLCVEMIQCSKLFQIKPDLTRKRPDKKQFDRKVDVESAVCYSVESTNNRRHVSSKACYDVSFQDGCISSYHTANASCNVEYVILLFIS